MHRGFDAAAIVLGVIVSLPVLLLFASPHERGTEQVNLLDFVAEQENMGFALVICSNVVLGFFVSQ